MVEDPIPQDLREFILRHIDSIAQLEALLLLRSNPDAGWSSTELATRLYIRPEDASDLLLRLQEDGFVSGEQDFRYSPQSPAHRTMVDRLAQAYSRQLIPITKMIHAKPTRIREFSDAFRLRRDRS